MKEWTELIIGQIRDLKIVDKTLTKEIKMLPSVQWVKKKVDEATDKVQEVVKQSEKSMIGVIGDRLQEKTDLFEAKAQQQLESMLMMTQELTQKFNTQIDVGMSS